MRRIFAYPTQWVQFQSAVQYFTHFIRFRRSIRFERNSSDFSKVRSCKVYVPLNLLYSHSKMTRACSIFLVSIVICVSLIHDGFAENIPYIGDCDIDKIQESGPIVLIIGNGDPDHAPTHFGNFSQFPHKMFICKTGKYPMKFQNFPVNPRALRSEKRTLILPFSEMNADELRLLALPQNLKRIIVPHNSIEHISYGTYLAHLTDLPFKFFY